MTTETEYAKEVTRLVTEENYSLAVATEHVIRDVSDRGRRIYLTNEVTRRAQKMIARRRDKRRRRQSATADARANEMRHAYRCD